LGRWEPCRRRRPACAAFFVNLTARFTRFAAETARIEEIDE
jgi:hypothetical protein